MTLKITQKIVNAVLAHGRRAEPNEACGYLAAKDGVINRIFELTNIDEAPDHYSMDPVEQFATVRQIRAEGLQLAAAYHTHPETPARPSVEDIRLANDPNIVYLIGSLMAGVEPVLAYKIKKGVVTEVLLTIVRN
ncbi:MAG: M67 family metallopeptidase [Desulfobulbaceae bacterium]|nr:M67 family metallopeptidase [Desulfobulbaceae bacterium]HIJ90468.1 M67 family metallopeptidase [Deltaproteobacteria bacterium]